MLNRLPREVPEFAALLSDLGLTAADSARVAKALGVSERTIWRWRRSGAPRIAGLALWWLSRWGHSAWDCEMHNRTTLALQQAEALWRELRRLRGASRESAGHLASIRRPGHAANDANGPAQRLDGA